MDLNTTLIIFNEEMEEIMKIVKCLQDPVLLIKGVSETIKNETKEQKRGFLGLLLGTLDASLLGNLLKGEGQLEQVKEQLEQENILMSPHPLTNFEIFEIL